MYSKTLDSRQTYLASTDAPNQPPSSKLKQMEHLFPSVLSKFNLFFHNIPLLKTLPHLPSVPFPTT